MIKRTGSETDKTGVEQTAHDLSAIPAAVLAAELRRRQRRVETLQASYERLMARAMKLREEIEALGGSPGRSEAKAATSATSQRPRNETSLVDVLKRVLAGNTMSVSEAAQKVIDAGYESSSASFRQIVNQTQQERPVRAGRARAVHGKTGMMHARIDKNRLVVRLEAAASRHAPWTKIMNLTETYPARPDRTRN